MSEASAIEVPVRRADPNTLRRTPSRTRASASCLVLVAAAGYGKTTELERSSDGLDAVYFYPTDVVRWLDEGALLGDDIRHLFIDGFAELTPPQQQRLTARLNRLPDHVTLTISSRQPLDACHRELLGRSCVDLGPAELALDFVAVSTVLRDEFAVYDAELASTVHRLTLGWPALVRLAGDAAAHGAQPADVLGALTAPGTLGSAWLEDQVFSELPDSARDALRLVHDLDPITPSLLASLPTAADDRGRVGLEQLFRLGLVRPSASARHPGRRSLTLVPVVRQWLRQRFEPPASAPDASRLTAAAEWYADHRYPMAAAHAYQAAGAEEACDRIVVAAGDALLAGGYASEVADLLPAERADASRVQRLLRADALRMSGDVTGALRTFSALVAEESGSGQANADLAWRLAGALYLKADYAAAAKVCRQSLAAHGDAAATPDFVRVRAYLASCQFMLGDEAQSAVDAGRAMADAEAIDDDRAIAFSHLAAALTTSGARRDNQLATALAAARRAGDIVTAARVLVNQADNALGDAEYATALTLATETLDAAEFLAPGILVSGLHNVGEALRGLGRCDEARPYFERSVAICRRLGLARTAGGLWGLAEIERQLGRRDLALAAYTEVVDLARDTGERQILVPGLAGLARVLATGAPLDEAVLAEARQLADEAVALACPEFASSALVARGWVALAAHEDDALGRAEAALTAAHARRSPSDCAEALELQAAATADPAAARAIAQQALEIWTRGGAELAANRVLAWIGDSLGASGTQRAQGKVARRWLVSRGVRLDTLSAPLDPQAPAVVELSVLGGFEARVGGAPVPVPAWKSRQARSLLKILAARQGRPTTRAELCEQLWPDDDPQRTGHRLSVLLSAVRAVLDPERAAPSDHFISADLVGISLDTHHVKVDATQFLSDADEAAELARSGQSERARDLLRDLDAAYRGDAFEDDPYAEWADGLREQTRAAWTRSLRLAAKLSRDDGEADLSSAYLVRLLALDPFDEAAYRDLVSLLAAAGRHGEARRTYDRWSESMRSIDAPLPDESILRAPHRTLIRR